MRAAVARGGSGRLGVSGVGGDGLGARRGAPIFILCGQRMERGSKLSKLTVGLKSGLSAEAVIRSWLFDCLVPNQVRMPRIHSLSTMFASHRSRQALNRSRGVCTPMR